MYGGPWALASRALLSAAVASFMLMQVLHRPSAIGYGIFALTATLSIVLAYLLVRQLRSR